MKKIILLMTLGLTVSTLSACSKTREQFDFSKKAPDEFAVITRAPLEMPATLDLPPPRPGIARPQESSPESQAQETLFGETQKQKPVTKITSGENILLQKTGATQADPNIRNVIDAETAEVIKDNTSTFDKIMGKAGKKIDAPATIVDPIKESERIIQNKNAGKPITEGETPTIEE